MLNWMTVLKSILILTHASLRFRRLYQILAILFTNGFGLVFMIDITLKSFKIVNQYEKTDECLDKASDFGK